MSDQAEAKKAAQYIAWFLGAFLGAGGGTVLLAPNTNGSDHEHNSVLESRLADLELQFREFRKPGDRFTADDGKRHSGRLEKLEAKADRCRETYLELKHRVWILENFNGRPE